MAGETTRERGEGHAVQVAVIGGLFTLAAAVVPLVLTGAIHVGGSPGSGTGPSTSSSRSTGTSGGTGSSARFDPTAPANLYASRDSAPSGATVMMSGDGFKPGETVTIRIGTDIVGRPHANSAGRFSAVAVTVPAEFSRLAPLQVDATATGEASVKSAETPLEVSG